MDHARCRKYGRKSVDWIKWPCAAKLRLSGRGPGSEGASVMEGVTRKSSVGVWGPVWMFGLGPIRVRGGDLHAGPRCDVFNQLGFCFCERVNA
jgi:hypothetical protein